MEQAAVLLPADGLLVQDIYRDGDDDGPFDDPPVRRVLVDVPTSEAKTSRFQPHSHKYKGLTAELLKDDTFPN